MMHGRKNYAAPMRDFLNTFASNENDAVDVKTIQKLSKDFQLSIAAINKSIGQSAFRPSGTLNAAVFEAVMVGMAERFQASVAEPGLAKSRGRIREAAGQPRLQKCYRASNRSRRPCGDTPNSWQSRHSRARKCLSRFRIASAKSRSLSWLRRYSSLDAEVAAYYCKLACVMVCGAIERSVEILITDRVGSRSAPQVQSFLKAFFQRGTNYDCDQIIALLYRFDADWATPSGNSSVVSREVV